MAQLLRSLFLVLLLSPLCARGEGSKQLTPNKSTAGLTSTLNDKAGYLAHDANFASASGVAITSLSFLKPSGFSRNGATYSKDHRLYIRVKAGETLYYGVHRAIHDQTTANQTDLTITLRRTNATSGVDDASFVQANTLRANTNSTRDMLLVENQNGVIDNAAEAENGPNRVAKGGYSAVSAGYTPLSITNNTSTDFDYYVEFTQAGESTWTDDGRRFSVYDLWDFTVIDASGAERQGRMRSKLWSFSAGGADNVFSKDFNMYPLVPSEDQPGKYFVKKIELAGIAPQNFFRFVTNSFGSTTGAGTTVEERRKSQNSQLDYPEHFNFVNNPDESVWPSATAPTFTVGIVNSCNTNTSGGKSIFNLNTSERSTFIVLINLNGVEGYQAGTADVLLESTGTKGARTVEWNGLDGLGKVVAQNTTLNYYFRNSSAPVHFPVWDAEKNVDGFKVFDVRPLSGSNSTNLLFWDDTNLPLASFPSPQSELYGVVSTNGVHKWGSSTATAGDLKTVNTWTYGYTDSKQQSATFTYDCSADVAVTNVAAAEPYAVGKEFTYTVTVTNNGPQPATNVQVTDKLDLNKLQFVSASDAAYNSSTGVWTVGSMAVGTSRTLTITVKPLIAGSISTTASQTHTEADKVTTNNSATATVTVQPSADLEVKNASDKSSYNNGDIVTYTMSAKNLGPNAATGVRLSTTLPDGLVPYGTVPAGFDAATGVWTVGNVAVNETKTITLQAQTIKTGTFTSTATLGSRTGYETDTNSSNNTSSNTITVSPAADIAVTNVVSNNGPGQGDNITYTIKATNNGPNNATNVSVANQIPASLAVTGYSASSGAFDAANGTWSIGTVVTSGSQTLTITAKPTTTGTLTVTSTQTHTEYDNQVNNNTASSTITVKPTADVAVTNVVTSPVKQKYDNGDRITYTVTVTNHGPSTATNVVVTDQLPASLTFISATTSSGTGAYDNATGKWAVGTLANGASATLTLVGEVNQSAVITTTASQEHTEYDNTNGNNSASNSITSGTGIITADIKVTTGMSPGPYYTGKQLTLGVRVDNLGSDAATGVSVNALVPAGFKFVSASPKVGSYDNATGMWTLGNLAARSFTGMNLVVEPLVDNTAAGDKGYTFSASKGSVNEHDSDLNNDAASTTFTVQKAADAVLSIAVTGDVNGVFHNGVTEATFVLTVTNNGPDKITNLVGQDTRTGTLRFTYVEPGKGYNSETGIWTVGDLEVGQSKTLTVKGVPITTGRLNLGGSILSADQTDRNAENNKAVALLQVVPVVDLQVTNTAAAGPYYNGQNTTFTVTVKNNSADAATGVKIEDKLPAGLTFVSATPSAGQYDAGTGIWTLGTDLLTGTTETLVLAVKPTSGATYSTTAFVKAANEYDSNAANNSASAQVEVQKTADIALGSSIEAGPYYVNGQYKVSITATNLGPDPATGVVVSARIASGLNTISGSGVTDGGAISAATGTWSIGSIGVNETKTLTFLVTPATTGTLNSRGYKSAANEYDPNGENTQNGNNSAVISFTVEDREATASVLLTNKHMYYFNTGDHIAVITDPDGPVQNTKIVNGALPAGVRLQNNGELEIDYKYALVPGTYTLTVETTDAAGGVSQTTFAYRISGDWDNDGIDDVNDLDDNNDGIITEPGAVNPTGDDDNDGVYNYLDKDFVHPVYGSFQDRNNDDINDAFDIDLDGLIRGYDIDIDGDGLLNAVEANAGVVPAGFDVTTGTFTGPVNAQGIPLAALNSNGTTILSAMDSDGDGYQDFQDVDTDNDGLEDNAEAQSTGGYGGRNGSDSDHDGLDNAYDPTCGCEQNSAAIIPVNTDGADQPDYLDLNSDNDLFEDFVESLDDNNDGITLDDYKVRAAAFEERTGKGFYTAEDSNGNGIPNWLERAGDRFAFLSPGNVYYRDSDRDGLVDLFDQQDNGYGVAQHLVQASGSSEYEYAARSSNLVVPLPVELLGFAARAEISEVVLSWSTASENGNDRFEIERSADGRNFLQVGQVRGHGNSSVLRSYGFTDRQPLTGTLYYRLRQVDYDGKSEYSKVVAVQVKHGTSSTKVSLYPNPATDRVHLRMATLPAAGGQARIFALDGRLVQQVPLTGEAEQTLDVSALAAGTYLIRLQGEGASQTLRFLKR